MHRFIPAADRPGGRPASGPAVRTASVAPPFLIASRSVRNA